MQAITHPNANTTIMVRYKYQKISKQEAEYDRSGNHKKIHHYSFFVFPESSGILSKMISSVKYKLNSS